MNQPKRLFLIDGMAQIYRAHFALINNPLITKDGQHTSAIFGFMNSLFKLLKQEKPDYLAIVLDSKEPTFRHELYTEYKATREKMPDELVSQLDPLIQIISYTKIPVLKKPGYEADDIIGTLTKKAEEANLLTYIVTGDKDMMQLVSDKTFMYSPGNSFKPKIIYDREKVISKWGVGPEGIVEMLSLVGDTSDNIPGIDGVGPKTAKKLLEKYKNIDTILKNAESAGNKRVVEGLKKGKDLIHLSKELATIDCNVPIDFHIEEFLRKTMETEKLQESFKELEMFSLLSQIDNFSDVKEANLNQDREYCNIVDMEKLIELANSLNMADLISFDLITTSLDPLSTKIIGLSFSIDFNKAFYIPISYDNKEQSRSLDLNEVLNILTPVFENRKNNFCSQNIKYNCLVLQSHGVSLNNIYFDTMIAAHILHPEKNSYKLDYLSLDYLKYRKKSIEDLIGSGLDQKSMVDIPLDDISFYSCESSDIVLQLTKLLYEELDSNKLLNSYNSIEKPLIDVLVEIEKNGVFIDLNYLQRLSVEFGSEIKVLTKNIYDLAGFEFNINSPKQLSEVLFDKLELKPIKKRSTAVEVLEVLKDYHPLPGVILKYRHLTKLKNTYLDTIPSHVNSVTGRVHTSLNQTITSTGRLSSSSPNFQNIPIRTEYGRKIRKAFVVQSKDNVILSADYSQVELRIMAHYSKEIELIDAFNNDLDIHTRTASLVNNIPELEVTKDQRREAKVVNFGIMYGAGPYRMSQELGINMADAKKLIEIYFTTYPGIKKYMNSTLESARKDGFVKTLFGRQRKTNNLFISNKNLVHAEERAAINMPIQGTAADIIKLAMVNIHRIIKDEGYKSKMILQIHDELLFECPKEEIEIFSSMVVKEMEQAVRLDVPLKVDWNYGESWYDAH